MKARSLTIIVLWYSVLLCPLEAQEWTAFRGSAGNGHSAATGVPVTWDSKTNIAWKTELPGRNNGSPIVSGQRILLTTASDDGKERRLHCFSAADGSQQWVRTVRFDRKIPTHKTNLYGGTTPATDGRRVVVWHASAGLYCYDMDGNELWNRNFGIFRHQWGYGTSPVIDGDTVVLHSGPGQHVFVAAIDLNTGAVKWKTDEPVENDGERNNENKYMGSWSTPVKTMSEGRPVYVCSMSTRTNAYDTNTGEIVWTCEGLRGPRGDLAYTSPVIAEDVCVVMGGFKGPAYGFRMAGTGNITEAARLWRTEDNNPQRIGSGVAVNGLVFVVNAGPNILQCLDPRTGRVLWKDRGGTAAYWGSLVYADGRLYATDQNSNTIVFEPDSDGLKTLALNRLDDPGNSTPAVADGAVYIRTFRHLYRISESSSE